MNSPSDVEATRNAPSGDETSAGAPSRGKEVARKNYPTEEQMDVLGNSAASADLVLECSRFLTC